jgi:DNA-binding winged helix-turn-helix (wHTH) protein
MRAVRCGTQLGPPPTPVPQKSVPQKPVPQKSLVVYRFGPYELDEALLELRLDGSTVPLGPKPLLLLIHLVAHRHKVVSKPELQAIGWPDQRIVDEAALRQQVSEIRKALSDPARISRWIRNAPGFGYQFIGKVEERPAVGQPDASTESVGYTTAFVDRDAEMAQLRGALQTARTGRSRIVLLHGPPGIGKTRTALELAAEARQAGFDVHRGRAHESAGAPPYRPWIEIFRGLEGSRGATELCSAAGNSMQGLALLVPHLLEEASPAATSVRSQAESERERFRLFDSVTTFLANLARRRPLLLILDDLHWADEASLLLLAFLAQSAVPAPLLIVAAHRDLGTAIEGPHEQALARIRREFSAESIALLGLTSESVGKMLRATLGVAAGEAFVEQVHASSGGNPLIVSEFARFLAAQGVSGADPRGSISVPDGLRDMVWNWISERSEPCRRLLQLASVIGTQCSLPLLRRTFQGSVEQLLEALAEAEHCGLLVRDSPGLYRFAHGAIRETLYDDLEDLQRVALHRSIGEALETIHGPTERLSELAHHFSEAAVLGCEERAVDYARRAAAEARALLAYEEAVDHYRRALRALEFLAAPDPELRCTLLLELGSAMTDAGASISDVTAVLTKVIELARALRLPGMLARAYAGLASGMLAREDLSGFDPVVVASMRSRLEPLLQEGLDALGSKDDPRVRGRLILLLSRLSFTSTRAQQLLSEALQIAEAASDSILKIECLLRQWSIVPTLDRSEERRALSEEVVELAQRTGRRDLERRGHGGLAFLALARGDRPAYDEARRQAGRFFGPSNSARAAPPSRDYLRAQLEGPLSDARQAMVETYNHGVELRLSLARNNAVYGAQHWWLGLLQADPHPVIRDFEESVRNTPHVIVTHSFLGRLYADAGDFKGARGHFSPLSAHVARQVPRDDHWLFYTTIVAETAALLGEKEQCKQLFEILRPYAHHFITLSWSILCLGSVARTLGTLSAALGEWEQSDAFFRDAELRNEAFRAPVLAVWSELEHARALHAHPERSQRLRAEHILESLAPRAAALGMSGCIEQTRSRFSSAS